MTVKQVRSFLGFAGYYRHFIPAFSKVAAPLHQLLQGQANRPSSPIQWTPDCQVAFDNLKQALLSAPILAYADFQLPFRLYTDASLDGLGAVLAQVHGGRERVIAYASRSLHPAERNDQNYSSFKLELLALKWAITEKFKDYLWGAEVTVFTDNNPLVHLGTAKLGATEQRWVAQLANYSYNIHYRPGRANRNADVLSRLPGEAAEHTVHTTAYITSLEPHTLQKQWGERQREDPDLQLLHTWKVSSEPPVVHNLATLSPQLRCLIREWHYLELCDGTLVRCVAEPDTGAPVKQIIIPEAQARPLWEEYHKAAAHASGDKMVSLLRRRFYWVGMSTNARKWAAECTTCVVGKSGAQPKAPLCPIVSSYPFETVALDYLSLGRPSDMYQYILVITDLFSRYALAVPTKDQTALTTVKALWTALILPFGCPERILTDQGAAFESTLMQQLCTMYGCRKIRTTPYHPQGNGACERFNRTRLSLLGTIETQSQAQWPGRLPALLQAYNNTTHASTGMTPHYVVFGHHARLPVDMLYQVAPPQCRDSLEGWVRSHHQTLLQAYATVRNNAERRNHWNQMHYNRNTRTLPLLPGERVLMRNFRRRAQGKLAPQWLPTPFVIVGQPHPDRPVFTIRPEGKDGPCRTLHRNNLRPCPGDPPSIDSNTKEGHQDGEHEPGLVNRPEPFWPTAPMVLIQPVPPPQPDPALTSLLGAANVPFFPTVTPPPVSVAPSNEAPGPELRMVGTAQDIIAPPQTVTQPPSAPVAPSHEAPGPELRMVGTAQDIIAPPQTVTQPPSASVAPSHEAPGPELRMVGTAQDTIAPPQTMLDLCPAPEHDQNLEPCAPSRYPARYNRGNLPARYRP